MNNLVIQSRADGEESPASEERSVHRNKTAPACARADTRADRQAIVVHLRGFLAVCAASIERVIRA
jgi:hypothetical protein